MKSLLGMNYQKEHVLVDYMKIKIGVDFSVTPIKGQGNRINDYDRKKRFLNYYLSQECNLKNFMCK